MQSEAGSPPARRSFLSQVSRGSQPAPDSVCPSLPPRVTWGEGDHGEPSPRQLAWRQEHGRLESYPPCRPAGSSARGCPLCPRLPSVPAAPACVQRSRTALTHRCAGAGCCSGTQLAPGPCAPWWLHWARGRVCAGQSGVRCSPLAAPRRRLAEVRGRSLSWCPPGLAWPGWPGQGPLIGMLGPRRFT